MITGIVLAEIGSNPIADTIKSLDFCDSILIVWDAKSKPKLKFPKRIKQICRPLGDDFASQRNFALSQVKSGWVFFIDSDEVVSKELAEEIQIITKSSHHDGYLIRRVDSIWGTVLKHGDTGNTKLLRLAKVGAGGWSGKVHEVWGVSNPGVLNNYIIHFPHPTVVDFLEHINRYSSIRAKELWDNGQRSNVFQITMYPIFKFLQLYIFKLGILDGTPGFIHAGLMSFHSFMVRGKLYLLGIGIS